MNRARVLVANRGEAASRIIRTLKRLSVETVAIHSEADRAAPFVGEADVAVEIGPAAASQSYLHLERIIEVGRKMQITALHPGWGFLSENPQLARRVEAEGWIYIGPTEQQATLLGDKTRARQIAEGAAVPCTPSVAAPKDEIADDEHWSDALQELGTPLLIKAVSGGGGKGMRIVRDAKLLHESLEAARREALTSFGNDAVFVEKLIEPARHIEVQVLGDGCGEVAILGDRECTLQRRHQKLIEEAPAPAISAGVRQQMHDAARRLATEVSYRGAGTVEFLLDGEDFYFLEMNTRLQVEHPVTEEVFGIDMVELQWQVATGAGIPDGTDHRKPHGHAIEVRVNAEDPGNRFLPSIGPLQLCIWPQMEKVRIDSGVVAGNRVTRHYDPMLAKIIAHGSDREEATATLVEAIERTLIAGVHTTLPLCRDLLISKDFDPGCAHTTRVEEAWSDWSPPHLDEQWCQVLRIAARQLLVPGDDDGEGVTGCWHTLPGRMWP